jgi:hypothetical protein
VGSIPWHRYNTLDDLGVVARQDALLRKTLEELNEFDNVYYEICDEPYFSGASPAETAAWQDHMIRDVRRSGESAAATALDRGEFRQTARSASRNPTPRFDVFNFHYCSPPDAVPNELGLSRNPSSSTRALGHGGHIALDRRREAVGVPFERWRRL